MYTQKYISIYQERERVIESFIIMYRVEQVERYLKLNKFKKFKSPIDGR